MVLKSKLSVARQGIAQQCPRGEALRGWELGSLDAPLDHAPFALDQLQFAKPQEVLDMILVLCGALPGQLGILALEGRQPELGQMMLEQDLRGFCGSIDHAAAPDSSTA